FQLRGVIKAFDNFTVLLETDGKQQLIFKHAISTFAPVKNVEIEKESEETRRTSANTNSVRFLMTFCLPSLWQEVKPCPCDTIEMIIIQIHSHLTTPTRMLN